jgi:type II secretory pathway component PulL
MRKGRTAGSSNRVKGRLAAVTALVCVAALSLASVALAAIVKSNKKTINLGAKSTKTVTVPYPDALKFGNARYTCKWQIRGVEPGKIKILSHGSVNGGTACAVKAHNPAAPSIDAGVKFTVIATTIRPGSPSGGNG